MLIYSIVVVTSRDLTDPEVNIAAIVDLTIHVSRTMTWDMKVYIWNDMRWHFWQQWRKQYGHSSDLNRFLYIQCLHDDPIYNILKCPY